ncbi:FAD-binding oxidoreductase [Maritimibacter sp. UBA3975]|uniref:FAD-binding oxidoreductase n=1 Tax=Maritimibacter sp. UBA3975 TaxID=1946833 RepID=UPI000C0918D8|nr:FAD-binding oxidoreductase [Maritimibacter sp. UBA3975]MAM60746.1 hydroxyacid dehydrogenase [Maritimibacter sp.]|tara:strand:- start:5694 stop:7112 length:1419 start_codon:yes stop_codon:yes gene_type:complete
MSDLNPADAAFEARLRDALPEAAFRPLTPAYLEEPRGLFQGGEGLLVAPGSTEDVAKVVRAALKARVAVVPYGGGTGLVGGQIMAEGPRPVILSLERMTQVRGVYPTENVVIAEAGVILADLQSAAEAEDRLFPMSLASEGSARLGGILSTNAGGVNVLRYGNTRELCLGLEAVLPDGTIWHGLKRLRKDNTGYDLRGILVGAEGTLGIITAASMRLFPRPARTGTALIAVESPAAALELLALAGARIGPGISAFELVSGQGPRFLVETDCPARCPMDPVPDWSVLIDLGLGAEDDPDAALTGLFEAALEASLAHDGVIASSETQRAELWQMREEIPEANRRIGSVSSHDISLPLSEIPAFLEHAGAAVAALGNFRINVFGHLGDGNLHYNIFPPKGVARDSLRDKRGAVAAVVYDLVAEKGGSFSAEHGIGRLKVADLARYGDPAKAAAMRAIKAALDPDGIMNPGVMLER